MCVCVCVCVFVSLSLYRHRNRKRIHHPHYWSHLAQFVRTFRPLCEPLGNQTPRGGWRQRLAHDGDEVVIKPPSLQALALLEEWGDGQTSAIRLAKLMRYGIEDGEMTHPMVVRLGRVAAGNPSTSAAARAIVNLLEECGFPQFITEVPGGVVGDPCCIAQHLHRHDGRKVSSSLHSTVRGRGGATSRFLEAVQATSGCV